MSINTSSFKTLQDDNRNAQDLTSLEINDATMDVIVDEITRYVIPTLKVQALLFEPKGRIDFAFAPSQNVNLRNGLIDFLNINGGRIDSRFITGDSLTLANAFSVGNAATGSALTFHPDGGIVGKGKAQMTGPLQIGNVSPGLVLRALPTQRIPLIPEIAYMTSITERQNLLSMVQLLEYSAELGGTRILLRAGWPFVRGPQVGDWILVEYPGNTSKFVAQVTAPVQYGDTTIVTDGNLMLQLSDPLQYTPPSNLAWVSGPQLWGESGSLYAFGPKLVTAQSLGVGTTAPNVSVDIAGTDAIQLPKGGRAERPIALNAGYLRYNAETQRFEGTTQANATANVWTDLVTVRDLTRTDQVRIGEVDRTNTSLVVLGSNARIGISTDHPAVSLDIHATDALGLPVGATETRPLVVGPDDVGYFRYNSSNHRLEVTRWVDEKVQWHHVLHEEDIVDATNEIYANVNLKIDSSLEPIEIALAAVEECCRQTRARLFEPAPPPTLIEIRSTTALVEVAIARPDQAELSFLDLYVPFLGEFQYDLVFPDGTQSSGTATQTPEETRRVRTVFLMTGAVPAGQSGVTPSQDHRVLAYYRSDTESVYLHTIEPVTPYGLQLYYKNEVDDTPPRKLVLTDLATFAAGVPTAPFLVSAQATMNTATLLVTPPADHDIEAEGNNPLPYLRNYRFRLTPLTTSRFGGLYSEAPLVLYGRENADQNDAPLENTVGPLWAGTEYEVTSDVRNYLNPQYGMPSNAQTFTTTLPSAPGRLTTAQGGLSSQAAHQLQYSLPGNGIPLEHRDLAGTRLYTSHFLVSEGHLQASPEMFASTIANVCSTLQVGNTADPSAVVQVDITSATGRERAQILLAGFGTPSRVGQTAAAASGAAQVRITQDEDHYADQNTPSLEGFWKRTGAVATLQDPDQFPSSEADYHLQLSIYHPSDTSLDLAKEIPFHVDRLTSVPLVSEGLYWTPDLRCISGIPTVAPQFTCRFQFHVQQLAAYFLRADQLHARFEGRGLAATLTRPEMHGTAPWEYREGTDQYAVSTTSFGGMLPPAHPKLQFHHLVYNVVLPSDTYTDDLTYRITAFNLLGPSVGLEAPYGDPQLGGRYLAQNGTAPNRGRADEAAVTWDRADQPIDAVAALSFSQYPVYIKGSIDSRTLDPSLRSNVGSVVLSAGRRVRAGLAADGQAAYAVSVYPQSSVWNDGSAGGIYDHTQSILATGVAELPFYKGKFRTGENARVLGIPFLDYTPYFDERIVRYDYRALNEETQLRWTAFLLRDLRQEDGTPLPSTSKFAGVRIYLDGLEGDWELDPAAQPSDHACWIRMYTDTTCTTPLTAWLNATHPYVGSWTEQEALTPGHACLNPSYLNTAAARHCYVNNLTPHDAVLLVRIGMHMNENKAFRSVRVTCVNVF